jgi:predicted ATPase/class 3 adenylate cyclase
VDSVTATFLFTDLVDSTALASRLGPDASERLRQTHFGILRTAAESTGGIEVKSTGDGLMLMFTSPSRALACAVAIQQGIERHNHRADEPLAVRIGLSMGEATEEEGDYYGDTVVEAARLCAAAEGGQILTTDLLRMLVGRHASQTFVSVGDLELKGIPEPVPAVAVVWEPESTPGAVPLPTRLVGAAADGLFGFFGRAAEVDALLQAAKQSATGQLHVALLQGEPGIGKTTLAGHVCRSIHAEGGVVLFGHCAEDLAIPYHPWIEALCHLVDHAPEDVLRAHVEKHGSVLVRIVPALARRLPDLPPPLEAAPDTERFLLLEAVAGLLAQLGEQSTVAIVLDDLQWADAASLQLFRHLFGSSTPPAALIIGTYRDTDIARGHPLTDLLADLRREPNVTRHVLRGLDDRELIELLEAASGQEMQEEGIALAHALHRETDGNPFFTAEILRHLGETGGITLGDDGRYTLTIDLTTDGLPGSVRDVVMRRVDRLDPEVNRVLSVAAVIGRDFDVEIVAPVVELDEDTLLDLLDAAVGAALVVEDADIAGRYRFEHALIQHTLYQDLSATRRQRTHQRIAQALETLGGGRGISNADLARHFLAATRAADSDKAIEYARLAGDDALTSLAPDDAIRWYSQALELADRHGAGEELRCDLLIGVGRAQSQAGLPAHRETLLEASRLAERLGDRDRIATAALANIRVSVTFEVDDERFTAVQRALEAVGVDDSPERALLLAALANAHDPREWQSMCELALEAREVARRLGDDATLLRVLMMTFEVLAQPERLTSQIELAHRAVDLAERFGDPGSRFQTRWSLAIASVCAGDLDTFDAQMEEMRAILVTAPLPFQTWQLAQLEAARIELTGDLVAAEAAAERTLEVGTRASQPEAMGVYGGALFGIRSRQGRLNELVDLIVDVADQYPMIDAMQAAVVVGLLAVDRREDAVRRFEPLRARLPSLIRNIQWLATMRHLAEASAELEDHDFASVVYDELHPFADQVIFPSVVVNGAVALPLGRLATMLGRYDDAEAHLDHARAIHERIGARYYLASTYLELGVLFAARGDAARARDHVAQSLALVDEHGFDGLRPRLQALQATLDG